MKIKMLGNFFRFLVLLIPALFIYLGFKYDDFFYYVLAFISIVFWFFILRPDFLSNRKFTLPEFKLLSFKIKVPEIHEPELLELFEEKTLGLKFSKKIHRSLIIIFLLSQLVFLYLAVFKLPLFPNNNLLVSYYSAQLIQMRDSWLYFFVGTLLAVMYLMFRRLRRKKIMIDSKKLLNAGSKSLVVVLSILVFSLSLSFLSTYIIALAQSNSVGAQNIVAGEKQVLEKLKNSDKAPKIVGVEKGLKRTLISLKLEKNNKLGKFYTQKLVPSLPDKLLILNIPKEALLMSDNHLLITELKKNEIESVSPVIGKLLVRQHLEPRYIKDEPEVKVLNRQEYLKYRDDQINKQLEKVDEILAEVQKNINIVYSNIQVDKNNIAQAQNLIASAQNSRESDYNYCKTAGYYSFYFGTFYRYYTDSQCEAKRQEWDNYIASLGESIRQNQANLSYDQSLLAQYQEYKKLFEDYKPYIEAQKDSAPDELGIFEPERFVKVVLDSTSNKAVGDYFATIVHEYLHYTSYVSEERQFTYPFFEEGLTEYFSRKIIEDQLSLDTNLGYPAIVKIIEEMTKKIPEDELKNVYFNKDEKTLIALLNKAYGSKFYQDSEFYFQAMSYVSGKEALKLANNIMFKIGGRELKEEDLISTYSVLK